MQTLLELKKQLMNSTRLQNDGVSIEMIYIDFNRHRTFFKEVPIED